MRGPKLRLNAAAVQAVGHAVHELATNAGKYGALSTDGGRVDVGWRSDADSFAISWAERCGPPVSPPGRRGFGSTVIESMVKRTVGGEVELDYPPSGFGWHLTCPAANALEAADIHKSSRSVVAIGTASVHSLIMTSRFRNAIFARETSLPRANSAPGCLRYSWVTTPTVASRGTAPSAFQHLHSVKRPLD